MSSYTDLRIDVPTVLVAGQGASRGQVLAADVPLSLWGGVDPASGRVIDHHHPLHGESWNGRVLVIPQGRGSCTGSAVLLEAIHAGHAPALIVLSQVDAIIALGAIVAEEVLGQSLPVIVLDAPGFAAAAGAQTAHFDGQCRLTLHTSVAAAHDYQTTATPAHSPAAKTLRLTPADRRCLAGANGAAARVAMRIIRRLAQLLGAPSLLDVSRVHIDACIYTGPAGLAFARQLLHWGGAVAVPTTLNAISIGRNVSSQRAGASQPRQPALGLADMYQRLGARPTFTCAPYQLQDPPQAGENIAWAESNAVVFANSVLGARTDKTPDLLDACIALTGRAPFAGYYRNDARRARVLVHVPPLARADDALYPLLGYAVGTLAQNRVPAVVGLNRAPTVDDLKAFGAAFATTASAGLFHIPGVTAEAETLADALAGRAPEKQLYLTRADLRAAWQAFNADERADMRTAVDVVALGNPHFSTREFAVLAQLCAGRRKHDSVDITVTSSRHAVAAAEQAGDLEHLHRFGVRVITDTCWCMLQSPTIATTARTIVTNSAKYAHYGPGLVGRTVRFSSLVGCVRAAVDGYVTGGLPEWLQQNV